MKKKTKRLFFLAGAAGCTMAAAIWLLPGTSAYFTDHYKGYYSMEEVMNGSQSSRMEMGGMM